MYPLFVLRLTVVAGLLVAPLGFAARAVAASLNGTAAIGSSGADETGANLLSRTSFTIGYASVGNTSGYLNGTPAPTDPHAITSNTVNIGSFDTADPTSFSARTSIAGRSGTFTAASFMQVTRRADFLSGMFTGNFVLDAPGVDGTFDGGSAIFRINLGRSNTGSDATVSFNGALVVVPDAAEYPRFGYSQSGSFWSGCFCSVSLIEAPFQFRQAPPHVQVPEPASMALLGVQLLGVGVLSFGPTRRKAG